MKLFKSVKWLLIVFFLTPAIGLAQDLTTTDVLQDTEQKVLEAESRGDYPEAINCLTPTFLSLLKEHQEKGEKERELLGAIGEAYLHKLINLYYQNYQPPTGGLAQAVKLLQEIQTYQVTPDFTAWVKYYLGSLYLKTNEVFKAREKYHELGFINNWQIIGPFDNENGEGFNIVYQPETEISLETTYEGKKIPVSWRYIKLDSILGGYVNLKSYLSPNNKSVGYALTYVFSDKNQPVVFRIASDESIKIWLNQTIIHSNDLQRKGCTIDQDICCGVLGEGWNQVLLKVATTRDSWGFRLRLTDLDGNLIKGLKNEARTTSIKTLSISKSLQTGAVRLTAPTLRAIDEALQKSPEHPNYYFYLGLIRQGRADFDYQRHLDSAAFQKAISASSNSPYYHYYFAQSLRERTTSLPEREENQYRTSLESVISLAPNHLLALTDLAEYYLYSLRNRTKSREYLSRALNSVREETDFVKARYLRTKLLKEEGFNMESSLSLKSLAGKNQDYLPVQLDYAQELINKGQIDEALTIYQNILRNIDYTNQMARERLINILIRQDNLKEALRLYEVMLLLEPTRVEVYLNRAKLMENQNDVESSLKEIQKALQICPDDPSLLGLQGQYLTQLGHSDEALQVWKKALRINPNNLSLQRYVDWIETTGESFEMSFKESVKTVLEKVRKEPLPKETLQGFPAHCLLNQVVTKINKDGTSRQYRHQIIRILNEKGIKDFQQIRLAYNPENQKVKVLSSQVIYPDGRCLDAPYIGGDVINLPPLELEAVIDIEYRREDIQQGFFGDYFGDTFYFGTSNPTYKSAYIIITPSNKPLYFHQKNIKLQPKIVYEKNQTTYIWESVNISGFSPEPMMPPLDEVVPTLEVSTYQDWKEFGRWYWHLIKRQYDINDEMRHVLFDYLVRPTMTTEEKIKAVYNFVIGAIRYVGWEYGIHGWKPYRASTIFARRFGDCKDKTTLINVFLSELGIKSYPVLIYAEETKGEDDLTLPMVEHFNHCIACAVLDDGREIWMDGTAVFNAAGSLPNEDTGAKVFVINEQGGVAKEIPPNKPSDNFRQEKNVVRIDRKGNARLQAEVSYLGDRGGNIRFSLFNPAKRISVMEQAIGARYGGSEVSSVETSRLEQLDMPVVLTVTASVPNFASREGKDFVFKPVIFPQELAESAFGGSERKFDLLLPLARYPYEDIIQTEFVLPIDTQVKSVPENVEINTKFGSFQINYKIKDDRVIFREKVSVNARRITKEDYKSFRDFCNRIIREENREIIITSK